MNWKRPQSRATCNILKDFKTYCGTRMIDVEKGYVGHCSLDPRCWNILKPFKTLIDDNHSSQLPDQYSSIKLSLLLICPDLLLLWSQLYSLTWIVNSHPLTGEWRATIIKMVRSVWVVLYSVSCSIVQLQIIFILNI